MDQSNAPVSNTLVHVTGLSKEDAIRLQETSLGSNKIKNLIVGVKVAESTNVLISAIRSKVIEPNVIGIASRSAADDSKWHENLIRLLGGCYLMDRVWYITSAQATPEFTDYAMEELKKYSVDSMDISHARMKVAEILTKSIDSKHVQSPRTQPASGTTRVPMQLDTMGKSLDAPIPVEILDDMEVDYNAQLPSLRAMNNAIHDHKRPKREQQQQTSAGKTAPPPPPPPPVHQQQQQTGAGKTAPLLSNAASFASAAVSQAVAAAANIAAPIAAFSSSSSSSSQGSSALRHAGTSVVPKNNEAVWTTMRNPLRVVNQTPAEVRGQVSRANRQYNKELKKTGTVTEATQKLRQHATLNASYAFVGSTVVKRSDGVWCPARGSTDPLPKAQYIENALQLPAKVDGKEGQQMCTAFMWLEKTAVADRNVFVAIRRTDFISACNVGKTSGSKDAEKLTPIYVQCNVGTNDEIAFAPECVIKLECDTINMMFPRSSDAVVRDMINVTTQQMNNLIFRFGLAFAEDRATRAQQRGHQQPAPLFRPTAQLTAGTEDQALAAKLRDLLDLNGS
jgi:hypothetical protein